MSKVYFAKVKVGEELISLANKAIGLLKKIPLLNSIKKNDLVGIKVHFGEKGNVGYIRAGIIKRTAEFLKTKTERVFVTDTNTLYRGSRANTVDHMQLAYAHGFDPSKINIPVIIADGLTGRNFTAVKVTGKHLKSVKIASDIANCDFLLCFTHVTGHMQTGVGGALKNLGMGCASRTGKLEMHSNVLPSVIEDKCEACGNCLKWCPADAISIEGGKAAITQKRCIGCGECTVVCKTGGIEIKWSENMHNLQEKVAEYALGTVRALGHKQICYINFITHITKDCDCMAKDEPVISSDIGIMASTDPVALDKASIDALISKNRKDIFRIGYPDIDWSVQLNHAEAIGLGKRKYEIEKLQENRLRR